MAAAGTLTRATIDAVVEGRHRDPFAVLGVHGQPHAATLKLPPLSVPRLTPHGR